MGTHESKGFCEMKDREGLCVTVVVSGDRITISRIYSRIEYIRLMTNSISGYRLADAKRAQRAVQTVGY